MFLHQPPHRTSPNPCLSTPTNTLQGAITILVILLLFPDPHRPRTPLTLPQRLQRLDPLGTLLFTPSILTLLLALQQGGTTHPWTSTPILSLLSASSLLLLSFLYLQHRLGDNATVPPRIFRQRNVWTAGLFALFLGAAFILSQYFLPLWFQAVKGASAVSSGLCNLPLLISVVVVSLVAGGLVTLWGHYAPFMLLSTLLMSLGYGLSTTLTPGSSAAAWVGYQLLAGAGVGAGLQQPLMAAQAVLPLRDVPTGTAIVVFLQTLGGAVSVSAGQAVFSNSLGGAPGADLLDVGGGRVDGDKAGAYNTGITRAFWVCAFAAAGTVFGSGLVQWRSLKTKRASSCA